ncbi:hypothetical protein ABES02_10200 [Neobacillus pocheonensis]|uniref:hypothetical protein n=1 Tax=Neobacillus pocheonensis TaxID=363869 RepID=UPI003D2D41EC
MKKEVIFWIHFFLFFLTNLNIHYVDYIRLTILLVYISSLVYVYINRSKFHFSFNRVYLLFILYIIIYLAFNHKINIHIIYWIVTFIIIKQMNFDKIQIISIFNKTAILYLILSIIFIYTPLNIYSAYEIRHLENKFFPSIDRFIGFEGSPAGPDLLFSILLISHIFLNKNKSKYVFIIISAIMLIWTSSFAPLVSILGALVIIPFRDNRMIKTCYIALILTYQFVVIFLYTFSGASIRYILDVFSTWRARVWFRVFTQLKEQSSLTDWLIGRKDLVEFPHIRDVIANNPHNFNIFILEFCGIFVYLILVLYIIYLFRDVKDMFQLFIISMLIMYSSTNTFIFTIRGNPVFLFIIIAFLMAGNQIPGNKINWKKPFILFKETLLKKG